MWNCIKQPDNLWALSLLAWCIGWAVFPAGRWFAGIAILLHAALLISGIVWLQTNFFCRAYCRRRGEHRRFALTFDDGPDPALTPAILDLLDEFGFSATFFVIGRRAVEYPEIVRNIVARGHTIGCHDLNHRWNANFRRYAAMRAEIDEACTIIDRIIGKRPRLYRPPVGLSNPHLRGVLGSLDLICIGWNRAPRDGGNRFVKKFRNLPRLADPGSIIMLHDCLPYPENREIVLRHLRLLMETARRKGLSGVDVASLLNIPAYRTSATSVV